MPTYISPSGNPETWDKKPKGYFETWEDYRLANPLTEEELATEHRNKILEKMRHFDFQSIRTLRELQDNIEVEYNKNKLTKINTTLIQLREELKELMPANVVN